jgi:hypothetical protein
MLTLAKPLLVFDNTRLSCPLHVTQIYQLLLFFVAKLKMASVSSQLRLHFGWRAKLSAASAHLLYSMRRVKRNESQ